MEAGEALSTAAQIAVALAGFAGVVVVFRRESVHEWSPIDKFSASTSAGQFNPPAGILHAWATPAHD